MAAGKTHTEDGGRQRAYISIDLKSFYASVECRERGLDPLTTHLVVADPSRTEKTICLAVTPALKSYGIPGRARLFEVNEKVRQVNALRLDRAVREGKAVKDENGRYRFSGSSHDAPALAADPSLELSFLIAPPRMAHYMEYSDRIHSIYLRYVAPEDMVVYSIDEVFIDATPYLDTYRMTARELAQTMLREVLDATGITATAGIGTNLYLAKVAMDIVAKRAQPDRDGARLAELDEGSYRRLLWDHTPLTDFWRVGRGTARKLEKVGLHTMGDVARCSLGRPGEYYNEDLLYKLFGVSAELLIDHAWGWEPVTVPDIRAYRPASESISSGQVLTRPYTAQETGIVVREMADALALELVDKGLATDQLTLTIGYDVENLRDPARREKYAGPVTTDSYGRQVPKHAHGTFNLPRPTDSAKLLTEGTMSLFRRIMDPELLARRVTLCANRLSDGSGSAPAQEEGEQLDLFSSPAAVQQEADEAALERERKLQQAVLGVKRKYGKNAILKGTDLQDGATAAARNGQIGGHRA